MTLLHQAAQKAVEALTDARNAYEAWGVGTTKLDRAIAALQQQPEPVTLSDGREQFEAWLRARWPGAATPIDEKTSAGFYIYNENNFYWEAWQAARSAPPALQHQEVPREPEPSGETLVQREEVCDAWSALPDDLRKDDRLTRLYHALGGPRMDDPTEAASPSTTRQQEVGSEPQDCPVCKNGYLAIRTDTYKDGREFVYCDCCGCMADRRVWNRIAAAPSTPEKAGGVPVARTYLHASRVDALIAVMEGECDGLAVTRETAEAILHYLDGNAPPVGVSASVPHPLPAQANDGGEHHGS